MNTLSLAVHAILGIFAFGALQFPGYYFGRVAQSENVAAIREAYKVASTRGRTFGPIVVLVALFGFWVAHVYGIPLASGWLIASYVDVVLLVGVGFGYHARHDMRVYDLAQKSPLDKASPELLAAIHDPMETPMAIASTLLWLALFYFMIAKPF